MRCRSRSALPRSTNGTPRRRAGCIKHVRRTGWARCAVVLASQTPRFEKEIGLMATLNAFYVRGAQDDGAIESAILGFQPSRARAQGDKNLVELLKCLGKSTCISGGDGGI